MWHPGWDAGHIRWGVTCRSAEGDESDPIMWQPERCNREHPGGEGVKRAWGGVDALSVRYAGDSQCPSPCAPQLRGKARTNAVVSSRRDSVGMVIGNFGTQTTRRDAAARDPELTILGNISDNLMLHDPPSRCSYSVPLSSPADTMPASVSLRWLPGILEKFENLWWYPSSNVGHTE